MPRLALLLLLSGVSAPALAQNLDRSGDERPTRMERSERADRSNRAERMEARSQAREERREQRAQRVERQAAQQPMVERQAVQQPVTERGRGTTERRPSAFGRQRMGVDIMPRQREVRTIPDTTAVVTPDRGTVTTQHRSRDGRRYSGDHRRWDRDRWRHDSRYDWRRYRERNRSTFRLGIYIDPFGWGYNRWGIGSRLYPSYYQSSYWLNDPWMYRLPTAHAPYRWVRYHNDALLIDTWSGEVVDVIYNFFW